MLVGTMLGFGASLNERGEAKKEDSVLHLGIK